jgi:hypothetical protein
MSLRRWLFALLIVAIGFESYTRFPSFAQIAAPEFPADTRELVLVFHGSGGATDPGLQAIAQQFAQHNSPNQSVRFINWSPFSDNIFRASAHGQQLASMLGDDLGRRLPGLKRLTLVAHSAGSYWLEPLCEAYRAATKQAAIIEMIYLDPIGTKGSWDYGYGYRHYGRCADFARAYINLDDAVPGTNDVLQQAFNIDVTTAAARAEFLRSGGDGHYWPVAYFLNLPAPSLAQPQLFDRQDGHQRFARGDTVQAE